MTESSQDQQPQKAKPKLVRIIARLNVGGPAQQACMLHKQLAADFSTYLITGSLAEGEQDMSYLLPSDRGLLPVPQMSREVSARADAQTCWTIWKFLRKERPQIVHTHTAKAGTVGRLAAWLARVPIIVHTYHGHAFDGYFSPLRTRMYLAIERFMARLSTRIIAISDSQLEELCVKYRLAPRGKFSIVRNGFALERFSGTLRAQARQELGLATSDFVVAWAGRMAPIKDVGLLAEVIRKSSLRPSNIRFLVVGDGTERPRFETLVQDCRNVQSLGWRLDIEQIWAAADAVLLTSRNEGTPTTLIEGMAAGLPFVSTDVGGVQDLALPPLTRLPNDIGYCAANGFLTAPNADALLYCIDQLARDPASASQMAACGKQFVLNAFCDSRLVQEMTQLYESLLKEREPDAVALPRSPRLGIKSQ